MDSGKVEDTVMFDCPDCNKSFDNEFSLKVHHGQIHDGSIAGYEYDCEYCGKIVEKSNKKLSENVFCSKDHHNKWMSNNQTKEDNPNWQNGKISKKCKICGDNFKVNKYRKQTAEVCSPKCQHKLLSQRYKGENSPRYSKVELECKNCNDLFKIVQSRSKQAKFCSPECKGAIQSEKYKGKNNPCWRGGKSKYKLSTWEEIREKVLNNRRNECRNCGISSEEYKSKKDRKLDVHHIIPVREFNNIKQASFSSNLVILCSSCHSSIEFMATSKQEKKLNLVQWRETI